MARGDQPGDGAGSASATMAMTRDHAIRLTELASLQTGWLDGAGEPIQRQAIEQAYRIFRDRPSLVSASNIFPTPAGGVMLEFAAGGWDLSLECLPSGGLEFFGVAIDGSEAAEPRHFTDITPKLLSDLDKHAGRSFAVDRSS